MNVNVTQSIKDALDKVLSFFLIILFSPVLLMIALMVKLDSKGPIFYRQQRVGLNGEPFKIWKFRTMVTDADKIGPVLTAKNDSRITNIGHLLRRTSLDELPQLFNVLTGEMSLVGPRPEVPEIVKTYNKRQLQALQAKPGITGLSQINGRDDLPIDIKLDYEVEYVETMSIANDFIIMLKTLPAVISGRGNRC